MHTLHSLKLFPILFFCILYMLSGCTYIPSTSATHMAKSDNLLYIATAKAKGTTANFIRLYDTDKNKWAGKIVFPNIKEPVIERMLSDNGRVVVQLQGNWKENGGIYSINKSGDINRIVELKGSESLSGMDDDYFYVTERKGVNNTVEKRTDWIYKGAKYNRRTNTRIEYHFEQNQDLVVRDVWEDDQSYWYACFQEGKPRGYVIPEGKLVVVSKSKLDGNVDIHELDGDNWKFDAQILGDKDWIWVFRNPSDGNASIKYRFIKFSKKDKKFELKKVNLNIFKPFNSNRYGESDDNLWLLNSSFSGAEVKVFRVDKESFTPTPIALPEEIRTRYTIYADKDYLWLDVYKLRSYAPSGNTVPYLLKISKNDLRYDLIFVEPTMGGAIGTILNNFFSWILAPFFRG